MEEKRRYSRVRIFTFIVINRNNKKNDAIAYDISLGGISIVNSQIFEVGEKCSIEFNYNGAGIKRSGTIKWRNIVNKLIGMKRYGIEFDTILSGSEFEKICNLFTEE